jgi:hypothetical protein
MGDKATKVAADNAMPGRTLSIVELQGGVVSTAKCVIETACA